VSLRFLYSPSFRGGVLGHFLGARVNAWPSSGCGSFRQWFTSNHFHFKVPSWQRLGTIWLFLVCPACWEGRSSFSPSGSVRQRSARQSSVRGNGQSPRSFEVHGPQFRGCTRLGVERDRQDLAVNVTFAARDHDIFYGLSLRTQNNVNRIGPRAFPCTPIRAT